MKKLAIVTTHPVQYNAPLFSTLSRRNKVEIKVFYTWDRDSKGDIDPGFGIKIEWDRPLLDGYDYCFSKNASQDPGSHHFKGIENPDLVCELENWKPDAIMVYGWKFRSHLQVMRKFHKRIPILFRGDSHLLDRASGLKSWARWGILRTVYRNIDCALFVGKANRDYFLKHGISKNRLVFAPHSVDNDYFSADSAERLSEAVRRRQELGISEETVVFLFAGKLIEKKSPALLLETFLKLPDYLLKRSHLLFVGDGKLKPALEKRGENYDQITFLPFQNQSSLPIIYRMANVFVLPSSNVFVLPSSSETWGLSVNEAMACGIPAIVSDRVGCEQDLVRDTGAGWSFAAGDGEALRKILSQAIELDKVGLSRMGKIAKSLISKYSYMNTSEAIEAAVDGNVA